jgi:hypothetical protein
VSGINGDALDCSGAAASNPRCQGLGCKLLSSCIPGTDGRR